MQKPSDVSFGQFLKFLLKRRDPGEQHRMTAKWFANELGYSESLISLWINEKRIPTSQQDIEHIKEILKLTAPDMRKLDILYQKILNEHRNKKNRIESVSNDDEKKPSLEQEILRSQPDTFFDETFIDEYPRDSLPANGEIVDTFPHFNILINQMLICGALTQPPSEAVITYFGESLKVIRTGKYWSHLLAALNLLLKKNWKVTCIIRISQDEERTLKFIREYVRQFALSELVDIYYVNYEFHLPPDGYVIVPGIGALHTFAVRNNEDVDSGMFFSDPKTMELTMAYLHNLRAFSHPLIQRFDSEQELIQWEEELTKGESQGKNRILFKEWLSLLTRPRSFYDPKSEWLSDRSEESKQLSIKHYNQRIEAFERNVRHHNYIDVYPIRIIDRFAQYGEYPHSKFERAALHHGLSPVCRREQLINVIHMLQAHEHYDIILVEEEQEQIIFETMYWEVVVGSAIYFQQYRTNEQNHTSKEYRFLISEPSVVLAFHRHAMNLISQIPFVRPKSEVISYFQDQVDYIDRNLL